MGEKVPRVVHGSFWIESDGVVLVRSTTRMIEETPETESPAGRLQSDLAGRRVTVTLKEGATQNPVIAGTVWEIPPAPAARAWDTDYSSLNPGTRGWNYRGAMPPHAPQPDTGAFLVLEDEAGNRRYIDRSSISTVS